MRGRPRIILLTGGALNGRRLSHALAADGVDFLVLTMSPPAPSRRKASLPTHLRRLVRNWVVSRGVLRRLWHARLLPYAGPSRFIGRCNSPAMLRKLHDATPELILMMGGGILSADVIRSARAGVLNAHPGALPQFRGTDVIRHSIAAGHPAAVTLHYIDEGIDTGRIIGRWLVPVLPGDDYEQIALRADLLGNALIRRAVEQFLRGELPTGEPQDGRHPLCRMLEPARAREIDKQILNGRARQLYERALADARMEDGAEVLAAYGTDETNVA